MSLLESIGQYYYVMWLAAAFFVYRSGKRGRWLAIGFGLLGAIGYLGSSVDRSMDPDEVRAFLTYLGYGRLLAMGFILAGAYRMMRPGAGDSTGLAGARAYSYLNPTEASMETLVIPRNETNSHTRAEDVRNQLYGRINRICAKEGAKVIGYKSAEKSGFVWVRFDYLLTQDRADVSLRASLSVVIERFDYHRHEQILTVMTTLGTRTKKEEGLIQLDDGDIEALNAYLTGGKSYPRLRSRRVRVSWYQFWRPRNKVERLAVDWLVVGSVLGFLGGGVLLSAVPWLGALLMIGGGAALGWVQWKRKTYILTTGKPRHDPRQLMRMDSWQVNIDGLGPRHAEVRTAIQDRLCAAEDRGIQVAMEQIWYPGVDGKVERDQIVCTFRRAIAFLEVEAYGDDLYVGWDSHVNSGTWMEQTLARGVDRHTRKFIIANRVTPGRQAPNEYDITDANFLTEWLHTSVVRVVRLKMAEHKIDQEIDFKVQRESRKDLLFEMQSRGPKEGESAGNQGRFSARLRRVD